MHDDDLRKTIARNLRRLMYERDLNNAKLSRKSGISRERLSIILHAKSGITVYTLRKIRDALECTWEELLD